MKSSSILYARLVLNHSTFIEGLLHVLKKLESAPLFLSIVPGRISTTKKSKQPNLELKLSNDHISKNKSSSIRLMARKGTQIQEIYIQYDNDMIDKHDKHDNINDDKNQQHKVLTYIKSYLKDDDICIRDTNDVNKINKHDNNNDKNKKQEALYSDKYLKFL